MDDEIMMVEENGMQAPSVTPMANSSCWVLEMEKMIGETTDGLGRPERPSIYRVPEYVKKMTNPEAYRPRLVSLGPFHHGDPTLVSMEVHKRRAMANMVKRSGKPLSEFLATVEEVADQLRGAYENLDEGWRGERFVQLMVTDGCFMLEVMRLCRLEGKVEQYYGPDDPVFSEHGYLYLKKDIISDMLVMENLLPLLLLKKLLHIAGCDKDDQHINKRVLDVLLSCAVTVQSPVDDHLGLHPLDVLHKSVRGARPQHSKPLTEVPHMPSAAEIRESGIHFKKSEATGFEGAVKFEGGILSVPPMLFKDEAERMFLNLMAFERLHPTAGNDVTTFVYFMDHLVKTASDVRLLRSKEIIDYRLGSDEAVANLINNTLSKGVVICKDSNLNDVIREVSAYCKNPWNGWWANLIHTHFSSPWVFISLVAATLLLTAAVMQTIYTAMAFYKNMS
uniref:Uncharacterized protein n=1 Tax=Leersia perrieri TaxID=77586 RepID=A0A0D9XV50_9ORYZ